MKHALKHCSYKRSYIYSKEESIENFYLGLPNIQRTSMRFHLLQNEIQTCFRKGLESWVSLFVITLSADKRPFLSSTHSNENRTKQGTREKCKKGQKDWNTYPPTIHLPSQVLNQKGSPFSQFMTSLLLVTLSVQSTCLHLP